MATLAVFAVAWAAAPAAAQTFTVQTVSNASLGNVAAAASGSTEFRQSTGGGVTVVAGSGTNLASGTKSAATVIIHCAGGGNANTRCNGKQAYVRVGPRTGVADGRATGTLDDFTAAAGTNATIGTVTLDAGSIWFPLTGWTNDANRGTETRTFTVGADLTILGDNAYGASPPPTASNGFYVSVGIASPPPTTAMGVGTITATVRRQLSITTERNSLRFGRVLRPTSGSNNVVIAASGGQRSLSGVGNATLMSSASGNVLYTITGEPSTSISVLINGGSPALNLTNGASSLGVALTNTLSSTWPTPAQSLPASGLLSVGIGGSLPVGPTTAPGSYSGSFTVVVQYN
jgi:hypothetical protein